MSDRIQFTSNAPITGDFLNEGFEGLERATHNLARDIGFRGIVVGFEPKAQRAPNLTIQLSGPGLAYDDEGQRIFAPMNQTVDCRYGITGRTDVTTPGCERWLAIAVSFVRRNEDISFEDRGRVIATRQHESFSVQVRPGMEAPRGQAEKPATAQDEILICHVRLLHGDNTITSNDIDASQRQGLQLWRASAVVSQGDGWQKLPVGAPIEDVLSRVDEILDHQETALESLVKPADWKVLPPSHTIQEALGNVDHALDGLQERMQDLVRPDGWQAIPATKTVQGAVDAIDRLLSEQRSALDTLAGTFAALSDRVDGIQKNTHPRAHRMHECVYYTTDVALPDFAPRDTHVLAVRLEGVRPDDVPGFARASNADMARRLQVQVLATLDGIVRLAFTNLTSHYLYPGNQKYEIGLWVPSEA